MERDFMGLSSKEPWALVKEEVISDGFKEIGFSKGSGRNWPFPNKVTAVPNLIPFKATQEDKTKRVATDSLVSPELLSLSTDPFEITKKPALPEVQKSLNREKGNGFGGYGMQHSNEVKAFPVCSYPNSMSMSNPFFKNHYMSKPICPTADYVAGITELCSKPCSSPAQLTIFYAGTVNVYDSISPEKAQAIMLLAGNGAPISSQPKIQVHEPISKAVVAPDSSPIPGPISTSPSSRLSSPLSGSGSTSTEDILAAKTTATPTTPITPIAKVDPPKIPVNNAATLIPSVPQARKASLARFLEKRKERAMNSAPYNLTKKSDGMDIHL